MSKDGNLIYITDSGDVSFINSVVKVGTKKSELSCLVDRWLRENSEKYADVEFYIVDVATFDDEEGDPMLGDIIPKFKTLPVFLFYHNNSLVASISDFNESNFILTLRETISQVLPGIDKKIVDHSFVNDLLKQQPVRSGERGMLPQQPPFRTKQPVQDISKSLNKYSKR